MHGIVSPSNMRKSYMKMSDKDQTQSVESVTISGAIEEEESDGEESTKKLNR